MCNPESVCHIDHLPESSQTYYMPVRAIFGEALMWEVSFSLDVNNAIKQTLKLQVHPPAADHPRALNTPQPGPTLQKWIKFDEIFDGYANCAMQMSPSSKIAIRSGLQKTISTREKNTGRTRVIKT